MVILLSSLLCVIAVDKIIRSSRLNALAVLRASEKRVIEVAPTASVR